MRLLSLREVSERLGIPLGTLHRATRALPDHPVHLPHVRLGKGIYVREEWVEEWLERIRSDKQAHVKRVENGTLQWEIKRLEERLRRARG